jgi:proton glutamate symport protein
MNGTLKRLVPKRHWFTTANLSRSANKPVVTIVSITIAIALGLSHHPIADNIRPLGEIYLALLQMSVLPFLLAAIPLAMRSAIGQHKAGGTAIRLLVLVAGFSILVAMVGIVLPATVFRLFPTTPQATEAVGGIVGGSSGQVDIEFIMDAERASRDISGNLVGRGLVGLVPSNIFAALSSNEITSVLIFSVIFGLSMAVNERRSGNSFFPQLKQLHDVCLLIFEWLNIFVPIGIVTLIAPALSHLGSDIILILARFVMLVVGGGLLLIGLSLVLIAMAAGFSVRRAFAAMVKPLSLVAATRNTSACVPIAVEVMTNELHVSRAGCELIIPLGFTIFRFGNILHAAATAIFIGSLVGREFSLLEMCVLGGLAVISSFATIGLAGTAGLASVASVLRPFALSFELALPILIVVDPIISMLRGMVNVAVVCAITALAAGRQLQEDVLLTPESALAVAE